MVYSYFRFCSFLLTLSLCVLGMITLSDVFIHTNTFRFQLLTIVCAMFFIGTGLIARLVYKNFSKLQQATNTAPALEKPLKSLMLVFGTVALFMILALTSLGYGMLQRMISGTALFG
jgi:ABC-type sulfate transport system permease component